MSKAELEHRLAIQNLRAGWLDPAISEDPRYGAAAAAEYAKCDALGCLDHVLEIPSAA